MIRLAKRDLPKIVDLITELYRFAQIFIGYNLFQLGLPSSEIEPHQTSVKNLFVEKNATQL